MQMRPGLRACLLALAGVAAVVAAYMAFRPRTTTAATNVVIPLELVLLVDTSGSVDEQEYELQQGGYVDAFRNEEITEQIEKMGGIAVVYVEWDTANNQTIRVPWTNLQTRADCLSFASAVQSLDRETSGTTMIAPALAFAKAQLEGNTYAGLRRVIDVSGDGLCKNWRYYGQGILDEGNDDPAHYGTRWDEVIADLTGSVDAINGVFIGNTDEHLDFYEDVLPLGTDAFSMHAPSFGAFSDTVRKKIMREISVPIPGMYD